MAGEQRRFGPDYVRANTKMTPESLPEQLGEGFRTFYAELSNEQKPWNAQYYSEDHNDAHRKQRHFLLAFLQHVRPASAQSLYQFMPPYRQILADQPDPVRARFDFLQSAVVSYSAQHLKASEARRKELNKLIEVRLVGRAEKQGLTLRPPPASSADADSGWRLMILQQVEFQALKRFVKEDEGSSNAADEIDERFRRCRNRGGSTSTWGHRQELLLEVRA